jgi:hypothetical protein
VNSINKKVESGYEAMAHLASRHASSKQPWNIVICRTQGDSVVEPVRRVGAQAWNFRLGGIKDPIAVTQI